jgi:hypothetical protein
VACACVELDEEQENVEQTRDKKAHAKGHVTDLALPEVTTALACEGMGATW